MLHSPVDKFNKFLADTWRQNKTNTHRNESTNANTNTNINANCKYKQNANTNIYKSEKFLPDSKSTLTRVTILETYLLDTR